MSIAIELFLFFFFFTLFPILGLMCDHFINRDTAFGEETEFGTWIGLSVSLALFFSFCGSWRFEKQPLDTLSTIKQQQISTETLDTLDEMQKERLVKELGADYLKEICKTL